jgi:ADP-heptose:LPS heptosyltransferase
VADRGRGRKALAVRLDSEGDVLLAGPALRQLGADVDLLHLLVSPGGAAAAALLPGIDEVLVADVPWMRDGAGPHDPQVLDRLLARLRSEQYDEVVVLTSFHQSPLPMALLAKWACATAGCRTATTRGSPAVTRCRRCRRSWPRPAIP